jgi:hypothetical protein
VRHIAGVMCAVVVVCFLAFGPAIRAQTVGPNSDPVYQQLRNVGLSGEAVTVNNLDLKRDAATFHLHSGTICFVTPVQGKVTGAVFVGDAHLILDPPIPGERSMLIARDRRSEFIVTTYSRHGTTC